MSKEVIFQALAFLDGYSPSPSMAGMKDSNQIKDTYIKNAVVSLISIKQHNPSTDVGIVVNFDVGKQWRKKLVDKEIIIWECPFAAFHMPQTIVYSLSYYKLCAFEYIVENTEYEKFCFMDCDTFAVGNFSPVWDECEDAFLIVPCDDSTEQKVRKEIISLYKICFQKRKRIAHYASGFIISTRKDIKKVLEKCNDVYEEIIKQKVEPAGGDEIIWSLALADIGLRMYSPKAYCLLSNIGLREYWVDKADYHDPNIVMWHLPTEKRYALIWAYDYYEKKGRMPVIEEMAKACRIRMIKSHYSLISLKAIMSDSTVIKRNLRKLVKG